MIRTRTLFQSIAVFIAFALNGSVMAQANKSIAVVATFSILGDMVERIGGTHVNVTTLVGRDGDSHVFQPTPADARAVSEAQLLIVNGLEFEGWLDRLIDASEFNGTRVVATKGIEPINFDEGEEHHDDDSHDKDEEQAESKEHEDDEHKVGEHAEEKGDDEHHHGAFDPHAWQSLADAKTYVNNITAALAQSNPAKATNFYQNRAAYIDEINILDVEIRQIVENLPANRRTVVTSHDAFQYFGRDYGLTFLAPQGLSTDSEASAQDVAHLIEQMREEGISAVFIENLTDSRLIEQIANETGAAIGGKLYTGALSGLDGPAPTYLDMMRHNATTLANALSLQGT